MHLSRQPAYMLLIVCFFLGAAALGLLGCSSTPEQIDVSYAPFEPTSLAWIAEGRGFFEDNDLVVVFHRYDTGSAAADAMLNGEAEIAIGVGEFPMVDRVLKQTEARIMASMDRSETISVVARRDKGIREPADLKGKRIGTTRGTAADFFLGRFLEIHGLGTGDVTLIDLKTPDQWVDAVANGDVDAVATAEPYVTLAKERLGANALVWSAHSGQPFYALVVAAEEWLQAHPESAERFLQALVEADQYAAENPKEAQAIVQRVLGMDPAFMKAVWERNRFSLTLEQSLIAAMEDEARWLISRKLVEATSVPDFLGYVWETGLEKVRPEAVNIIRASSE